MNDARLPLYKPSLYISPLLTIVPRTATARSDGPSNTTESSTDGECTCGTYQALDFIDISSDYQIDLPDQLSSNGHNFTLVVPHDLPYVMDSKKRDECPLCSIFFYGFTRNIDQWLPPPILASLRVKSDGFWSQHSASEAAKKMYSTIRSPYWAESIGSFSNNAGMYKPQVVPELADLTRAKSWLQNCTTQHARCVDQKPVVEGMRLIDCRSQEICEGGPSSRWVALSYVWGLKLSTEPPDSALEDLGLLSNAPQTIKDAMNVTVELGFRYLWVDAYCIEQGHEANKADQINKMDRIYRGAELTIVATGSDKTSGLCGISTARKPSHKLFRMKERYILFTGPDPSESTRQSEWWSRGWTFQEGYLSKRLLLFGEQQMTFHCNTSAWMESLSGPETVENPSEIDWNTWSANVSLYKSQMNESKDARYHSYHRFIDLVQQYTRRDLRFDSDALRAFAGITHHLQRSDPPIHNFAGLPYVPWAGLDAREKLIGFALAWDIRGKKGIPERRPDFPSWTWAGWKGLAIWYERSYLSNLEQYSSTAHNICFESASPPGTIVAIRSNPSQNFLDGVRAVHLEALLVPAKYMTLGGLWYSPDHPDALSRITKHWCPVTSAQLLENLAQGVWSCFMLGYVRHSSFTDDKSSVVLLIVEWRDENTAVRIGSVNYRCVSLPVQVVDTLERRKVRLV